jgi:hypothetical protein
MAGFLEKAIVSGKNDQCDAARQRAVSRRKPPLQK